ncbi:MAG: hypothetical protein GY862_30485 [Gammaproteobacteria bacterium]|nr:hypothetical protein [Gammaproteobacteria bacterium]
MNLQNKTVLPHVVLSIAFAISMFLAFATAFANQLIATSLTQLELMPDDPDTVNQFGHSVASDGNTLVIGAPTDDTANEDAGAVYVFVSSPNGWVQQAKLTVDGIGATSQFGSSVAIDGDILVAGAPRESASDPLSGAAYVFVRNDGIWGSPSKLVSGQVLSDGVRDTAFLGTSVAISGDIIAIGVPRNNYPGAYVFEWSGTAWEGRAALLPDGAVSNARAGQAVAVSENTIIVGAPSDNNHKGIRSGAAYLFEHNGVEWVQKTKLEPDDARIDGEFGNSVAINNGIMAVGAISETNAAGETSGAVYLFVKTEENWIADGRLTAIDGHAGDEFGISVAASGNQVLIGAAKAGSTGMTYLFTRQNAGWQQQMALVARNGEMGDWFGHAITLNADTAVIGAYKTGGETGAAYTINIARARGLIQLLASDTQPDDGFGFTVDADGDTLVIGAVHAAHEGRGNFGSAYIFVRKGLGWEEEAELVADDIGFNYKFGTSVAVSGDTAAVGAARAEVEDGRTMGAVYIFVRKREGGEVRWTQQAKLTARNANEMNMFGSFVSISENTLAASAPAKANELNIISFNPFTGEVELEFSAGSVYVFERNDAVWRESVELPVNHLTEKDLPPDIDLFALYTDLQAGNMDIYMEFIEVITSNIPVAINGDTLLIGTPRADINAVDSGAAYMYGREGNTWEKQAEILPSDISANAAFGTSVALSGNTAAIGQAGHLYEGVSGNAYVFEFDGTNWNEQAKLSPDVGDDTLFGFSIAANNDAVLVGAPFDQERGNNSGAAYLYTKQADNSWIIGLWTNFTAAPGTALKGQISIAWGSAPG